MKKYTSETILYAALNICVSDQTNNRPTQHVLYVLTETDAEREVKRQRQRAAQGKGESEPRCAAYLLSRRHTTEPSGMNELLYIALIN